jgi:hypothetical protein
MRSDYRIWMLSGRASYVFREIVIYVESRSSSNNARKGNGFSSHWCPRTAKWKQNNKICLRPSESLGCLFSLQNKRGFEGKFRIQTTVGSAQLRGSARAPSSWSSDINLAESSCIIFTVKSIQHEIIKRGDGAGKAVKNTYPSPTPCILFSHRHIYRERKMYIFISAARPLSFMPLFFLLALTLRGFAARVAQISHGKCTRSNPDVIMIRTIVVKSVRARAHRESAIENDGGLDIWSAFSY